MSNAERDRTLYRYPGSSVLRNKLDIRDADAFDEAERMLVRQRLREGPPDGDFDLDHLRAIHRHLFQDVYEWAGELRQVDFRKTDWFHPYGRIEMGMADVHRRLLRQDFLRGLPADAFAEGAGVIIGDVNVCHPFREGNGRTQLVYLKQLGARAGHEIDLARLERDSWIEASIASIRAEYGKMAACIGEAICRDPPG